MGVLEVCAVGVALRCFTVTVFCRCTYLCFFFGRCFSGRQAASIASMAFLGQRLNGSCFASSSYGGNWGWMVLALGWVWEPKSLPCQVCAEQYTTCVMMIIRCCHTSELPSTAVTHRLQPHSTTSTVFSSLHRIISQSPARQSSRHLGSKPHIDP